MSLQRPGENAHNSAYISTLDRRPVMGWKDWAVIRMKAVHCLFFDMAIWHGYTPLFSVLNDWDTHWKRRQAKGERLVYSRLVTETQASEKARWTLWIRLRSSSHILYFLYLYFRECSTFHFQMSAKHADKFYLI